MYDMWKRIVSAVFLILTGLSCQESDLPLPVFNGERAYDYLKAQVAFGPRVPGTEASAQCRRFFYDHFTGLGAAIDSQTFTFFDPYTRTDTPMVNVIASFAGDDKATARIVLMAHYDSRPRTDYARDTSLRDTPIDGANDGASGVAVLMELGNLFAAQPPPCHVDLVMVDGEDWGKAGDTQYYLLGSREFARRGIHGKYRFGIVLDMIGDAHQEIYREGYSEKAAKPLNDAVWNIAAQLGITTFHDTVKYTIIDDHLSLISGGVPAIDIIDFDYPYWHTEFDTPDKCSPEALSNVGEIMVKLIYTKSLWPKMK